MRSPVDADSHTAQSAPKATVSAEALKGDNHQPPRIGCVLQITYL